MLLEPTLSIKILLIEDEPAICDNIQLACELERITVQITHTGKEGLESLQDHRFDLIILDVGLPDTSGFEICKIIRKNSDIPIIFLTARHDEIDKILGLEIGADDYLTKPFSPRELMARIKSILRRVSHLQKTKEDTKPFQVDAESKTILIKGQAISLGRYEYKILEMFHRQPGRIFSRDEIMLEVWEDPATSFDRTIDAHIKSIRAKFKTVHHQELIITRRGFGYGLVEKID